MESYIGVTGFTKPEEVQAALNAFPVGGSRKLMVGVLASSKTLLGERPKARWAPRYPRIEDIAPLFLDDPRVLNLVHFHTDATQPSELYDDLLRLRDFAGPNLHGFQLNIAWPNPVVLEMVQTQCLLSLVLQLGAGTIEDHHRDGKSIAHSVQRYNGCIDAVLLDPGGGTGRALDPGAALSVLRTLKAPGLALGVAGGLAPETLALVEPLLPEFPDLSIDAEGRLRNERSELDPDRVRAYLERALALFNR